LQLCRSCAVLAPNDLQCTRTWPLVVYGRTSHVLMHHTCIFARRCFTGIQCAPTAFWLCAPYTGAASPLQCGAKRTVAGSKHNVTSASSRAVVSRTQTFKSIPSAQWRARSTMCVVPRCCITDTNIEVQSKRALTAFW